MNAVSALRRTYVLQACLADLPEIWRRFTVPSDLLLADLHAALQIVFDWDDQHLHFFERAGVRYGIPDGDESRVEDQSGIRVSQLVSEPGESLRYVYDFTNWWEHRLELHAVRPFATGEVVPRCVDGARAGPPEDCGGASGFRHLLEVLAEPAHPEHADVVAWLDGYYHPQAFSVAATNDRLERFLGGRRRRP